MNCIKNQEMYIRWGDSTSNGNGIKQSGIQSPRLFNVYMDGLSKELKLNSSRIGVNVGSKLINHLCCTVAHETYPVLLLHNKINAVAVTAASFIASKSP